MYFPTSQSVQPFDQKLGEHRWVQEQLSAAQSATRANIKKSILVVFARTLPSMPSIVLGDLVGGYLGTPGEWAATKNHKNPHCAISPDECVELFS